MYVSFFCAVFYCLKAVPLHSLSSFVLIYIRRVVWGPVVLLQLEESFGKLSNDSKVLENTTEYE